MQFIKTTDGNFALTYSKSKPNEMDIKLMKFDENGYVLWSETYGDGANEAITQVMETNDGGFAMTGFKQYSGQIARYYLLKVNTSGIFEWDRSYDTFGEGAIAFSVQQTHDDGYILGGYAFSPDTDYDMYVIRTNANGGVIWERNWGGGRDGLRL